MNEAVRSMAEHDAREAQRICVAVNDVLWSAHELASPSAMLTALAQSTAIVLHATTEDAVRARLRASHFARALDRALALIADDEPSPSPADAEPGSANDPTTPF